MALPSPESLRPTNTKASPPPQQKPLAPAPQAASKLPSSLPSNASSIQAKPSSSGSDTLVSIPLAEISTNWDERIRKLLASSPSGAAIQLQSKDLESKLKTGKIVYALKAIVPAITPPIAGLSVGELENESVELPLKIVVPIFMQAHKPSRKQTVIQVTDSLPDFFTGKTPPSPSITQAPLPPESPAQTNQQTQSRPQAVPSATPENPPIETSPKPKSIQEVVDLIARAKGMEGALVALEDGMVVASSLQPGYNADFIAAFLPAFVQRTVELLKALNFTDTDRIVLVHEHLQFTALSMGKSFLLVISLKGDAPPSKLLDDSTQFIKSQNP